MNKILKIFFGLIILILLICYYNNRELIFRKNYFNKYIYNIRRERLKEKGFFSDKYHAKKYIHDNYPYCKFAKIFYRLKNPDDLKNIKLPKNCIIKSTSGSHNNMIIRNNKYNIKIIIKKCKKFLKNKYRNKWYDHLLKIDEPHYLYNDHAIIIEELLDIKEEYSFHMFYDMLLFIEKKYNTSNNLYDQNFNLIENTKFLKEFNHNFNKIPKKFNEMKKLCYNFQQKNKFKYVRIDFYVCKNNELYFSEFTFTPNACVGKISKKVDNMIKSQIYK